MNEERITPEHITKLEPNEIFVFGSNLAGRHGKGAAKTAMRFGAIYGQGIGLQGQTYAIPTKDSKLLTLPHDYIKSYVMEFLGFAKGHQEFVFLVTKVGCGLAGISISRMAGIFNEFEIPYNVKLPREFWEVIEGDKK